MSTCCSMRAFTYLCLPTKLAFTIRVRESTLTFIFTAAVVQLSLFLFLTLFTSTIPSFSLLVAICLFITSAAPSKAHT